MAETSASGAAHTTRPASTARRATESSRTSALAMMTPTVRSPEANVQRLGDLVRSLTLTEPDATHESWSSGTTQQPWPATDSSRVVVAGVFGDGTHLSRQR